MSLDSVLQSLVRRLRWREVGRGVALTLAAVVAIVLLSCAADWWWRLERPGVRIVLGTGILAAGVVLGGGLIVRPLLRRYCLVELAARIEAARPGWRGALASSVEFGAAECDPRLGAPALQRAVIERTTARLSEDDLAAVIDNRPLQRSLALALTCCLLAAAAVAADEQRAALALHRLLSPARAPEWPQRHKLELLDADLRPLARSGPALHFAADAPAVVYVGDSRARLPGDACLLVADGEGRVRRMELPPVTIVDAEGRRRDVGEAVLPPAAAPYHIRATGGDDEDMPWHEVHFSPIPAVEQARVTITPPAYAAQPPRTIVAEPGRIEEFVGTRVRVEAQANVPLARVVFRRDGRPSEALSLSADGRQFRVEFEIGEPGRFAWWFDLTDRNGLGNTDPPRFEARGIADTPPVVSIERPPADLTVTPDAELPLTVRVRDDVGIAQAWLVLSDPPGSVGERMLPLPVDAPGVRDAELETVLGLSDLALAPGRQVVFRAEADDGWDLGPRHIGQSGVRSLQIVSAEEKLRELQGRQSGLAQGLQGAAGLQQQSLQQTRGLRLQWQTARAFPPEDADLLKRVAHDQSRIGVDLNDERRGVSPRALALLEELAWNRLDDPATAERLERLQRDLRRLATEVLPVSEQALDRARRFTEPGGSNVPEADVEAALAAAEAAQTEAAATLDALLALFADWQRQYDLRRQMDEIAAGQRQLQTDTAAVGRRTLTRRLSELTPQEQADLARLSERQSQLARPVQRLADELERLLAAADAERSALTPDDLREALDVVRQGAIAETMQQAGRAIALNQFGETLQAQQRVQQSLEELEQVLRGLGAADPETLLKQVRQAEAETELLRRRQEESLQKSRELADAGRAADEGELQRLQGQQQELAAQTEASARRLRRQQFLRPATSAARAADAMRSAADALQEDVAPEALAAQQDAIDDLLQAQRSLAELRRQLEVGRAAARMAELATLLETLGGRQQHLREETGRLDAQQRERGSLSRSQLKTLRDLGDGQSQLARDVGDLAGTLVDVQVFQAVLSAARSDMELAAGRLAERLVDAATQSAQEDAIRRLADLRAVLVDSQAASGRPAGETEAAADASIDAVSDVTLLAQLRLLVRMQAAIARRVDGLAAQLSPGGEPAEEQRAELARLAAEQAGITALLSELVPGETGEPAGAPASETVPPNPKLVIEETLPLMRTAEARLAESRLDAETVGLQKQIVQNLEKLLQLAEQQAAQRQEAVPDEQPADSTSQASPAGGTGDERRQSPDAGESSEEDRPGEGLSDVEIQRRKALATAVWGHLPPRLRDKMHGAFSERFLPQYDELVRKYYEALATQGEDEP
jgi:hypothetical protein